MDYAGIRSLPAMLFDRAATGGERPFLWARAGKAWRPTAWRAFADEAGALAKGLIAHGVAPGDRVALIAENRPEWVMADIAIMAAGAITVPAYTTHTVDDHAYLLADSGAAMAIVSTAALARRVLPAAARVGIPVVLIEAPPDDSAGATVVAWDDLVARGRDLAGPLAGRTPSVSRSDGACLIYTSGTGGRPKGVLLSHGNVLANCDSAHALLEGLGPVRFGREVFLSFLPLSHAYEHSAGLYFAVSVGAQIHYADGADGLTQDMAEVRPTIMTAVPRLFEVMHQRMQHGLKRMTPRQRRLFERTVALGLKRYQDPRALTPGERLVDAGLELLVRRKVRRRFGGRLKAFVSGGAPLNLEVGLYFHALGVPMLQGYGQTEAAPFISCNPPGRVKLHTVGPPLKGVEVRIAEDGEILVRGPNVMAGYWRDPEATARTVIDGWLHTGDVGSLDADGYLQITDRKRDLIVVSGGDNLSPAKLEGLLGIEPEIAQAMVYGDRHAYLVALLVPGDTLIERDPATIRAALAAAVDRVNRRVSAIERIRSFLVADEPFSIANGLMTPTLKIRRHRLREVYGARLESLYDARGTPAG